MLHSVLWGNGGDIFPTPGAAEVSLQRLQVLPWKLYPSLVDLPLGNGVV